jgi:hypothetical protein
MHSQQQIPEPPDAPFGNNAAVPTTTPAPYYLQKHHDHRSRTEKQQRRLQLALFVKSLLKTLKEENEIRLHQQVRMVISMCTRGHKLMGFSGPPLEDILEAYLRPFVGESNWQRATHLQRHYLDRKCRRQKVTSSYSSVTGGVIRRRIVPI